MPILTHKFRVFMAMDANPWIERLAKVIGIKPKTLSGLPIGNHVLKISVDRLDDKIYLSILQEKELAGLAERILNRRVLIEVLMLDSNDDVVEHNSYRCKCLGFDTHMDYSASELARYNFVFRII